MDVLPAKRPEERYSSSWEQKHRAGHEKLTNEERLPADNNDAEIELSGDESLSTSTTTTKVPRNPTVDSKAERPRLDSAVAARPAVALAIVQSRAEERKPIRRVDFFSAGQDNRDMTYADRHYLIPRLVAYYKGIAWAPKSRSPISSVREIKPVPTMQPKSVTTFDIAMTAYKKKLDNVSKSVLANPTYGRSLERLHSPGVLPNERHATSGKEPSPLWSVLSQQNQQKQQQQEHNHYHEQQQKQHHNQQPRQLQQQQHHKNNEQIPLSQPGDNDRSRVQQIVIPNARANKKYSIVYVQKSRVNPHLWAYFQGGDLSTKTQTRVNPRNNIDVMKQTEVYIPSTGVVNYSIQPVAQSNKKRHQVQQLFGNVITHPERKQVTPRLEAVQHHFRLAATNRQRWNSKAITEDANMAPRAAADVNKDFVATAPTSKPEALPTKVVLVTYMRGGSSLFGELFNNNPQDMYWFEPMDAVYSYLYGTAEGWLPLDIAFDQSREMR